MITYLCMKCNKLHGWGDHSNVTKVTRWSRLPSEDVWYCPNCGREHRTTDGTMFGQAQKLWKIVVDPDNFVP